MLNLLLNFQPDEIENYEKRIKDDYTDLMTKINKVKMLQQNKKSKRKWKMLLSL